MGAGGAAHSAGQARRRQANGGRARGGQRPDVCAEHRLPVAGDPQGPAAALDDLRLFRSVELGGHAQSHPRRALPALSRGGLARGEPDRRHHPRVEEPGDQPERQERGKRGACVDPPGYDAGKKIKGKKRHVLVDTQGLLMHAIVHAADIQDRDGGALVMASLFGAFPFLVKLYADAGYQGPQFQSAMKRVLARLNVEIVKRSDQVKGFVVLPKRWIVERSLAWLGRCRRLAKDEDWPRIGNASTARRSASCASPPSASCCESYAIPRDLRGQTLSSK